VLPTLVAPHDEQAEDVGAEGAYHYEG
jgi:hypothetical protein